MYKMKIKRHEAMYGPHFNETMAMKAVSHMENEDGTEGAHWDIHQTTAVAQQFNVDLSTDKYNKYDWFVALNMIYSDYYKSVMAMTNSTNIKHYVELAKAWLDDKDVAEGKMWYYFKYVICDKFREDDDDEEESEEYGYYRERMPMNRYASRRLYYDDEDDYYRNPVTRSYRREPINNRIISKY